MHQNTVVLDCIKDEVVFFDQIAISKFYEFLFAWNSAELRMFCEVNEALFDFSRYRFCGSEVIGADVGNDLV